MTTSRPWLPKPARDLVVVTVAIAVAVAAIVAWLGAMPVDAAPGAQTPPTITPGPVPTAATTFSLSNASCDETGADGWRVQTFIINAGVAVESFAFDQGGTFDRIGTDRDNSDGTIASPLWKGAVPGTGFLPANSPSGLINPTDLAGFDFSDAGWALTDGNYQIGYVCIDDTLAVNQWWVLPVTIDADASPNPFLAAGTGVGTTTTTTSTTTTSTTSSTTSTTTGATTTTTTGGTTTTTTGGTTTTVPCATTTTAGATTSTTQCATTTTTGGTTTTVGSGATTSTTARSGVLGTGSSNLPRTGQGLVVVAGLGLVLILVGRAVHLLGRTGSSMTRR